MQHNGSYPVQWSIRLSVYALAAYSMYALAMRVETLTPQSFFFPYLMYTIFSSFGSGTMVESAGDVINTMLLTDVVGFMGISFLVSKREVSLRPKFLFGSVPVVSGLIALHVWYISLSNGRGDFWQDSSGLAVEFMMFAVLGLFLGAIWFLIKNGPDSRTLGVLGQPE